MNRICTDNVNLKWSKRCNTNMSISSPLREYADEDMYIENTTSTEFIDGQSVRTWWNNQHFTVNTTHTKWTKALQKLSNFKKICMMQKSNKEILLRKIGNFDQINKHVIESNKRRIEFYCKIVDYFLTRETKQWENKQHQCVSCGTEYDSSLLYCPQYSNMSQTIHACHVHWSTDHTNVVCGFCLQNDQIEVTQGVYICWWDGVSEDWRHAAFI